MGQKLCCLKQSTAIDEPKKVTPCDSNCSAYAYSISSMKMEQKRKSLIRPATKTLGVTESWTLEQWLLNSPDVTISQCTNSLGSPNQLKVVQKYQKIELSSPDLRTDFFTPRKSFSSDRLGLLGKIDEEEDEGSSGGSIGGKVKKRVSFKLPEEADIIIFYSPKDKFEEY